MKITFKLTMNHPIVNKKEFQEVSFKWTEEMTEKKLLEVSKNWITSKNYLTRKMNGLERVKESLLTIEEELK